MFFERTGKHACHQRRKNRRCTAQAGSRAGRGCIADIHDAHQARAQPSINEGNGLVFPDGNSHILGHGQIGCHGVDVQSELRVGGNPGRNQNDGNADQDIHRRHTKNPEPVIDPQCQCASYQHIGQCLIDNDQPNRNDHRIDLDSGHQLTANRRNRKTCKGTAY